MKKAYYSIGLLAVAASVALVISCRKGDDQPINLQSPQSVTANKEDPTPHWDYEHPDWENEGYPDCGGTEQSPINIVRHDVTTDPSLTALTVSYANVMPLSELDNGHTLQVVNTTGNTITVNGSSYDLLQFHFHAGSEHTINGQQFPMEIHFVNKNSSTNKITVIGVLVKEGAYNAQVEKIFNNWPATTDVTVATGKKIHLEGLLPCTKDYYTYPGSLTTPPCTEGLQWLVLKRTITMSHAQIEYFKTHYHDNFRPVQPLNGRVVKTL